MRVVLTPFLRHGMWNEVGAMTHVPLASSVLQRRRGYKDVLRHHLALRAAACLPVDDAVMGKQLLGMKDVAALYELWCYFAVVRELEAVLGTPSHAGRPTADNMQVGVDRGLSVSWASGVEVFYNLSFSRGALAERRSASLLLRPTSSSRCPVRPERRCTFWTRSCVFRYGSRGRRRRRRRRGVLELQAYRRRKDARLSRCAAQRAQCLHPVPRRQGGHLPRARSSATSADAIGALPLIPGGGAAELHRWLRAILGAAVAT